MTKRAIVLLLTNKKTFGKTKGHRLKTNSRTTKMQFLCIGFYEQKIFQYKCLGEPFAAPLKHFCLLRHLSPNVPYANTLLCVVLTHFVCSFYGILAVCTPVGMVFSSAWVFHRLPACRQILCLHAETFGKTKGHFYYELTFYLK